MIRYYTFVFILFFFATVGCTCVRSGKVVARVGSYTLYERDLELRRDVLRVYAPDTSDPEVLANLISVFSKAEVVKKYGLDLGDKTLEDEAKRIEANTKAPAKLKEIRAVFKGDEAAYLRLYVLPVFVERAIYKDVFAKSKELHKLPLQTASDFLQAAKQLGIEKAAKQKNLKVSRVQTAIDFNSSPPSADASVGSEPQLQMIASSDENLWALEVVRTTPAGALFDRLLDMGEEFQVVRYQGQNKKTGMYEFSIVSFQKSDYGNWLQTAMKAVPVEIESSSSR